MLKTFLILILTASAALADSTLRIAVTIYAEAKGESIEGKRAVASVIWNRAADAITTHRYSWDTAITRVCDRPAFSCWPKRGWPKAPDMRIPAQRRAWHTSYELACQIQAGTFDPTTGARHYAEKTLKNYWTVEAVMLADVGNHRFYR
jgi:spore germination cell wall hydrolase CwlJ-like protein